MPSEAKNQQAATSSDNEATAATERTEAEASAELEFESMDLTVESVEERISPSETNVFDK